LVQQTENVPLQGLLVWEHWQPLESAWQRVPWYELLVQQTENVPVQGLLEGEQTQLLASV